MCSYICRFNFPREIRYVALPFFRFVCEHPNVMDILSHWSEHRILHAHNDAKICEPLSNELNKYFIINFAIEETTSYTLLISLIRRLSAQNITPYHARIKCLSVFRHLIWHLIWTLQSELRDIVVRNVRNVWKVKSANENLIDRHRNHMNNFVSLTAYLWAPPYCGGIHGIHPYIFCWWPWPHNKCSTWIPIW